MFCSQTARRLPARARSAIISEAQEPSSKLSSTSTNPSSSVGGIAALRKRTALGDMTNASSRRVFGGSATSESVQSSVKNVSSGAVTKGKLALRDSNVTTTGASRVGKVVNGKPVATAPSQVIPKASKQPAATVIDGNRPVRTSKRATTAVSGIPARTKVASNASTFSRSNSVQSTGSQKNAVNSKEASVKTATGDRDVNKRVKTDRGEKRVTTTAGHKDSEAGNLLHKKSSVAAATKEVPEEDLPAKDEGWEDLDAEDADDPLMVAEYVNEIFDYMKELEMDYIPSGDYIDKHPDINWEMRGVLVDWLIDIHSKFRLLPETLFLAQNIVDRFLTLRTISLNKLQLVGLTAMFLAAKYEEVLCPSVQNFLYLAEGGYTEEEILKAERYMLKVLKFSFSYSNPMNFLRRISKADNYDIQTRTVAKFFMEISLVDHRLLEHPPSLIAAAAVWNARLVLERGDWSPTLVHYSTYSAQELLQTAELMLDYCLRPVQHQCFIKKYSGKKFMKAAPYVIEWSKKTYGDFTEEDIKEEELLLDLFAQFGYERASSIHKTISERGSTAGPEEDIDEEEEEQQQFNEEEEAEEELEDEQEEEEKVEYPHSKDQQQQQRHNQGITSRREKARK
ncbi:hypothetical protein CBS101457_002878 [Exobasidium rhododendri]|nr:hypothetical protein CBS101457_002878 [Exobasidium rhododendri]